MDLFIKSSYAATKELSKADSVHPVTNTFSETIDEYRLYIMFTALLLSLISLIWQIWKAVNDQKKESQHRKEDQDLSINEDFWHKSVILPLFIDKFVSCIAIWIDSISECTVENINDTRDSFKKDKRELSSRTRLLCTVNETSRQQIREYLDDIEDSVIAYLYELQVDNARNMATSSIHDKILSKVECIFKELIQDHHRFSAKVLTDNSFGAERNQAHQS